MKAAFKVKNLILMGLYVGYLLDKQGALKDNVTPFELKDLVNLKHEDNSMNWSGIRYGVSFAVIIDK